MEPVSPPVLPPQGSWGQAGVRSTVGRHRAGRTAARNSLSWLPWEVWPRGSSWWKQDWGHGVTDSAPWTPGGCLTFSLSLEGRDGNRRPWGGNATQLLLGTAQRFFSPRPPVSLTLTPGQPSPCRHKGKSGSPRDTQTVSHRGHPSLFKGVLHPRRGRQGMAPICGREGDPPHQTLPPR